MTEKFHDSGAPVFEDPTQVTVNPAHDGGPVEKPEIHIETHGIGDQCARIVCDEFVGVVPEAKRTSELDIDEPSGWLPFLNLRAPPDGDPVKPESIVDECTRAQRIGWCASDPEMEEIRGDTL